MSFSRRFFVGFGTIYDPTPDPEDDGTDVNAFANFIRATKASSRGAITGDATAGEGLFIQVGCAVCHVASIRTTAPGTKLNGNSFTVPRALGNMTIHPDSDFLLHDIGTGDGIPILPQPRIRLDRAANPHRATLAPAHPQPVDARRPHFHPAGGDRAACRRGDQRGRGLRRPHHRATGAGIAFRNSL